ncbi:MAG: UDP-N-acetylmuramoyl-tripeptide--D-alanyl-D-alanine ligase [Pseudomonadota bacterium]
MSLWTLQSLSEACGGTLRGASAQTPVTGISIDTRTLSPGNAFFAVQGVSMDGHRFVGDALARGASAAVVSKGEETPSILVDDPLAALGRAGIAARARLQPGTPVVAVTGSVGKTGTKEMLRLAFGEGTHASAASHNNLWGVPLSLANMPADARAGIFEIGMNHAGEITPLTKMVRPTVAIITTVEAVHLEFFKSVEGIADAKAEIFAGLEPGGVAIIPADNPHTERLKSAARAVGARVVTFGGGEADVTLSAFDAMAGTATAKVFGEGVSFTLHGDAHIARNALSVLAALSVTGRPLSGAEHLASWQAPRGRGRRVSLDLRGGRALLIDEAYNANPASMGAAIKALGTTHAARRIAILGDMLELGDTSTELHRGLAPLLVDADVRIVHTVGPMAQSLRDSLPAELRGDHHGDAAAAAASPPEVAPGDAVLVKGSNAIGLSRVVDILEERYGPRAEGLAHV